MKFGRTETPTLSQAMELTNQYANGEEVDRLRSGKSWAGDAHQSQNKGKKHKQKSYAEGNSEAATLASQGKKNSQKKKKDCKGKK